MDTHIGKYGVKNWIKTQIIKLQIQRPKQRTEEARRRPIRRGLQDQVQRKRRGNEGRRIAAKFRFVWVIFLNAKNQVVPLNNETNTSEKLANGDYMTSFPAAISEVFNK